MKKQLLNPILVLAGAVAATVLTGCSSVGPGYTDITGARNALGYTTVTDPVEMSKWTGDKYMMQSLRSLDTYTFRVRDTGYNPGGGFAQRDQVVVEPDVTYQSASGAPAQYQSETHTAGQGYKIIQYRPGAR